jgi:hypothetical protein
MPASHRAVLVTLAAALMLVLAGCRHTPATSDAQDAGNEPSRHVPAWSMPAGTPVRVTLGTTISSETASVGDSWTGTVDTPVDLGGSVVVPAGSPASGVVVAVTPAARGERAMLDLGLRSFTVGAHAYRVRGRTEAVYAGSTRARNLGAIAGATVAGAVIGHAIGGSSRGTALGALIGGGAATGVVAHSRGWQVELRPGTPLTFTTSEPVALRR